MLNQLNHVAIAVPNIQKAVEFYRDILGAKVSDPIDLKEHGVTSVFVYLANTKLELITPLGEDSPIAGYLAKHPLGGLHHLCFEVNDVQTSADAVKNVGVRILKNPMPGSQGKPVVFFHPKDTFGCLLELEESS